TRAGGRCSGRGCRPAGCRRTRRRRGRTRPASDGSSRWGCWSTTRHRCGWGIRGRARRRGGCRGGGQGGGGGGAWVAREWAAGVVEGGWTRALVETALADLAAGREAPAIGEQVGAAALWSAARHGMTGPGIHPVLERRVPAAVLVSELLSAVRPALEESGDL